MTRRNLLLAKVKSLRIVDQGRKISYRSSNTPLIPFVYYMIA